MLFDGYTGGGGKEVDRRHDGTGDIGYLDEAGALFVVGRDDDMIVSGGENVFPREIEDLLSDHKDVAEAAVIGVDDKEYGQRLKAFVVLRGGGTTIGEGPEGVRQVQSGRVQGPARHRVHGRVAAQRDRQGPEARALLARA